MSPLRKGGENPGKNVKEIFHALDNAFVERIFRLNRSLAHIKVNLRVHHPACLSFSFLPVALNRFRQAAALKSPPYKILACLLPKQGKVSKRGFISAFFAISR